MAYEMKQVDARVELLPTLILEAKDGVISRNDVRNGGTLRVPIVAQAKVGDKLMAIVRGSYIFFGPVTYNEVNLGKPLDFNVPYVVFSEAETITTEYVLEQGEDRFLSPITEYELKD
jgi:hypothetical protein